MRARYRHTDEEQCGESLPVASDLEADVYHVVPTDTLPGVEAPRWTAVGGLAPVNVHESLRQEELPLFGTAASTTAQRALAGPVNELRCGFGRDTIIRGHGLKLRDKQG